MKKFVVSGLVLVLVLGLMASTALAALPGTGWWVFYQVQNVGASAGVLSMQAFGASGTFSGDCPIGAGKALAFHPGLAPNCETGGDRIGFDDPTGANGPSGLPDGFEGSAVLSADVPIVAVAQLGNNPSGSVGVQGGTARSFYQGIGGASAASKVNFPTAKHNFNGQTTTFYVQAAGADTTATISWNMNNGESHTQSLAIPANHMVAFDPAAAGVPSNCTAPAAESACLGAATVVASEGTAIVGVVVEHPHQGSPAQFVLATRGFTAADEATVLVAPTIKYDFNGGVTGFSVQNVGTLAASVDAVFVVTNIARGSAAEAAGVQIGDTFTESDVAIPVGQAVVFSKHRNNLGGMPAGVFAAATVSSDQPIVGSVNESNTGVAANNPTLAAEGAKAAYAAFAAAGATDVVAAPLVKEMFNGSTTGLTVVNAGDAATRFEAQYTDADGTTRVLRTVEAVDPGEAVPFFTVYNNLGGRFEAVSGFGANGFSELFDSKNSVIVRAMTDGVAIVGLAQESDRADELNDIMNYEAFNITE